MPRPNYTSPIQDPPSYGSTLDPRSESYLAGNNTSSSLPASSLRDYDYETDPTGYDDHEIYDELPEYVSGSRVQVLPVEDSPANKNSLIPKIDIILDHPEKNYDLGDLVTGKAVVTLWNIDRPIDFIAVELLALERVFQSKWTGDTTVTRKLRVAKYTIPRHAYPENGILLAGHQYTFQFSLLIPDIMGPSACPQSVDAHCRLPPSLGCPLGVHSKNREALNTVIRILYQLSVTIIGPRSNMRNEQVSTRLVDACRYLNFAPSYAAIPKDPSSTSSLNVHRCIKPVRRGLLFKEFAGSICLEATELAPLALDCRLSSVQLRVKFTPKVPTATPPQIQQISSNLLIHTVASMTHLQAGTPSIEPNSDYRVFCEDININRLDLPRCQWSLCPKSEGDQTDSLTCYQTSLTVPISLPECDKIIPSFNSCFSSRQYEISISIQCSGGSKTTLRIPVIIVASYIPRLFSSHLQPSLSIDSETEEPTYDASNSMHNPSYTNSSFTSAQSLSSDQFTGSGNVSENQNNTQRSMSNHVPLYLCEKYLFEDSIMVDTFEM